MQYLSPRARQRLTGYVTALAQSYGITDTRQFFALTDPQDIALRDAIMHSDEFLGHLTMETVDQLKGQVVVTGAPGLYTGRLQNARFSREMGVDGNQYELVEMDSGSYLPYHTLTTWANAGSDNEFYNRIQTFSNRSFAHDILRIGFNGTHAALNTDPATYPRGEDIAPGWHQIVKDRAPGQIVSTATTVDINGGGDFTGLDAMANDARNTLIAEELRDSPDLVVLISRDLLTAETTALLNQIDKPTEKVAAAMMNRQLAGMDVYTPPFLPDGRLIVTTLWNLHVYTQRGTEQRKAEWVDDRKRFENNYLRMSGYAVEYDELYAAFDNIAFA